MRLEGLGQLKNPATSLDRTRDLPACSIVPQSTTLPRVPIILISGLITRELFSHIVLVYDSR
jgi:hypothetical protein